MRSRRRQPSDQLLSLLRAEGLAARCDLDRCTPLVRSLAAELPDFDSVWLDAMVQLRQLTPWQASQLQLNPPGSLSAGNYLLLQPLGTHTHLAVHRKNNQTFALSRLCDRSDAAAAGLRSAAQNLLDRIRTVRQCPPEACVLPTELSEDNHGQLWLATPYAGHWSLDELLIRGGRLPWSAVAEIGRELLHCLIWFEQSGVLHGDLTTAAVRLNDHGRVRLTSACARRIRRPASSIGQQLTLRDCEATAPELAQAARQPDRRSELYSLGCLLWQLLAGRPVIISADPVRRMISQREHDVADIRGLVPECPEWLARQIQTMTRRLPELRPDGAAEVLRHWDAPSGFSALRQIIRTLPESRKSAIQLAVPAFRSLSTPRHILRKAGWPVAAFTALGGLLLIASESTAPLMPLTINRWQKLLTSTPATPAVEAPATTAVTATNQIISELPEPDAAGFVRLEAGRRYRPRNIQLPGRLTIECSGTPAATVEIPSAGQWILAGSTVELRGLQVSRDSAPLETTVPRQLIAVQCSSLLMQRCHIQSPTASDECSGIAWFRPPGQPGILEAQNSIFGGGGYAVSCNHPPQRLQLENVLLACRGGGLLLEFGPQDPTEWQTTLTNVTQRFGFSLLDAIVHPEGPQQLALQIVSQDCVYQPRMAVVRIRPPGDWKPTDMQIRFQTDSGHPAIVNPEAESAVYIDRSLNQTVALPETSLPDNMLLFVSSTFADTEQQSPRSPWEASLLLDFDGPKLSDRLPGILSGAGRMPATTP